MSRKKKIPVPEPDQKEIEYICPSASWGDMTGLIPAGVNSGDEINSYSEVYPFMPHTD